MSSKQLPALPALPKPPALPAVKPVTVLPAPRPVAPVAKPAGGGDIIDGKWRQLPQESVGKPQAAPMPHLSTPVPAAPQRLVQRVTRPVTRARESWPGALPRPGLVGGGLGFGLSHLLSFAGLLSFAWPHTILASIVGFFSLDWFFGPSRRNRQRRPVTLYHFAVPRAAGELVGIALLQAGVTIQPEEFGDSHDGQQMAEFVFGVPAYHIGVAKRALDALNVEWRMVG